MKISTIKLIVMAVAFAACSSQAVLAAGNVGAGALIQLTDEDLKDYVGGEGYAGWEINPNVVLRTGVTFGSGDVGKENVDAYSLDGMLIVRTYPDVATFLPESVPGSIFLRAISRNLMMIRP